MPTPRQVSFQHAEEKKRSQPLKILLQKPGKASQVLTMCSHRSPSGCQGTELVAPGLTTTFSCLPFPGCFPDPVTSTFLMLFPVPHFPVSKTCHLANHQFLRYYSQFPHFLDSSKSIRARWAGGCCPLGGKLLLELTAGRSQGCGSEPLLFKLLGSTHRGSTRMGKGLEGEAGGV